MTLTTADALRPAADLVAAARAGRSDHEALEHLAGFDAGELAAALSRPEDRLAFWINVYNGAVRARLLADPAAYGNRLRFFTASAITVAGRRLSPNAIEHGILRRSAFGLSLGYVRNPFPSGFERRHRVAALDARVHFALNCGARSCPPLAAYDPDHLDGQLEAASRAYLAAETHVLDGGSTVVVPRLMLWYLGDFGGRAGIVDLLRHHGLVETRATPRVTFGTYDWTLAVTGDAGRDVAASPDRSEPASPAMEG